MKNHERGMVRLKTNGINFFYFFLIGSMCLFLIKSYVIQQRIYTGLLSEIVSLLPVNVGEVQGIGKLPYREVKVLARYYDKKDSENPYKNAIYWLANVIIVEDLARKSGIELRRVEIRDLANDLPEEFEGRLLRRSLIAEPILAYRGLREKGLTDVELRDAGRVRIEELYELTAVIGVNFFDIARLNSEFTNSAQGGYLGFVKKADLDEAWWPYFETSDEFSGIVELSDAYAFARFYSERNVEEREREMRIIGIYKRGIDAAIEAYAQNHPVKLY
jgi:hypothetical protein